MVIHIGRADPVGVVVQVDRAKVDAESGSAGDIGQSLMKVGSGEQKKISRVAREPQPRGLQILDHVRVGDAQTRVIILPADPLAVVIVDPPGVLEGT